MKEISIDLWKRQCYWVVSYQSVSYWLIQINIIRKYTEKFCKSKDFNPKIKLHLKLIFDKEKNRSMTWFIIPSCDLTRKFTMISVETSESIWKIVKLQLDQGAPQRIGARQGPVFYPKFFEWLFLLRAYWDPKSRQGPGLGALPVMVSLNLLVVSKSKTG
jgi:hypothetical protein